MENTAYGTPTGWNNTYAVDPVDWRKVLIEKVEHIEKRVDRIEKTQEELMKLLFCYIRANGYTVDRILERYEEEYYYYKESLK